MQIAPSRKKALTVLFLCWMTYVLAYCNRMNFSVAMIGMQKELGFSTSSLSMMGMLFYFAYAFGQLINGKVGDLIPSKIMVCVGLGVSSFCNLLFGVVTGFWPLAVIWMVNGFALSALWGPMARQLATRFPPEYRDVIAMVMSSSMAVGYLLSWGTSDIVINSASWRALFVIPGAVSLAYFAVLLIFFPYNKKAVSSEANEESPQEPPKTYRILDIWKPMGFTLLIVASVSHGVIKDGISFFSPYILSANSGSLPPFIILMPFFNLIGSFMAFYINRKMRARVNLTLITLFGGGFAFMLALVLLKPFLSEFIVVALLGCVSSCMCAANMLLMGSIPMHYAQYGLVSTVAGTLDFASYIAASGASVISGKLFEFAGIDGILILWCAMTIPAILSMLLRQRRETRASLVTAGEAG